MKSIIAIAILMLASCASKQTTAPVAATPAQAETAQTAVATTKAEVKKAEKKMKAAKTTATTAVTETAANVTEAVCKAGSDERKLAIATKDAGCELHYTKAGETKVVASQIKGNEKCEKVLATIKEKLTAAKYECQ